jgi:hypothetical protein
MSRIPTPLFILGSGRSGTTITATLLGHLPRVQISKETGYISQNIRLLRDIDDPKSMRRLVDIVNTWLTVSQPDYLASIDGFHRFCDRHGLQGSAAFIHYIWQLDSPKPWHELEYIGDNTPLYVMAIPAIQELLPDAKFIHMVRDPRDVVTSMLKMRFGADDPVIAALEWHTALGCWLLAERIVPAKRRMECRYEDLCTSPQETMNRLAQFVNHTEAEAMKALADHASAGAMQNTGFETVATAKHHRRLIEPVDASRIGRYRGELSVGQIQKIEAIAQYGMLAYGYEPSGWHDHPFIWEDRISLLKSMLQDFAKRCSKRLRGK